MAQAVGRQAAGGLEVSVLPSRRLLSGKAATPGVKALVLDTVVSGTMIVDATQIMCPQGRSWLRKEAKPGAAQKNRHQFAWGWCIDPLSASLNAAGNL